MAEPKAEPKCLTCLRACTGDADVAECYTCRFHGGVSRTQGTTTWPMVTEALGVFPDQVEAERAAYKQHGIPVEVLDDGRVRIPDQGAYAQALKLNGLRNKSEGYHGA